MNVDSLLITSQSGMHAYADVDDLLPEERLELLDAAHSGGWEPVQRGVQALTETDGQGKPSGVAYVEYWFFRRIDVS